jgi:DNA repair protein RadA/Sms
VTKEGALAGPRVLEHLVDCVLQFEGERERTYRTVRAIKNRFGSTNEAGVFEMRQGGLVEVLDASARFVAEATRAPGSVVLARWRARVRCSSRCRRWSRLRARAAAAGRDRAWTATGWRSCWRCSAATAESALGGADVFVNVVGGSARG